MSQLEPAMPYDAQVNPGLATEPKIRARSVSAFYGDKQALFDVTIDVPDRGVMAFIGPSGCGKSTFLRCLNRMNDTIEGARVAGTAATKAFMPMSSSGAVSPSACATPMIVAVSTPG